MSTNAFSRTGYAFAGWTTAADGSGTAYADGASDRLQRLRSPSSPSGRPTPATPSPSTATAPTAGSIGPRDRINVPTPLTLQRLYPHGLRLRRLDHRRRRLGHRLRRRRQLCLQRQSVTLFAQWTANASYSVTFNGNGSTGGLDVHRDRLNVPTALTLQRL